VRSHLEKTLHKKGLVEWLQDVCPEFKLQYCKKKKKKNPHPNSLRLFSLIHFIRLSEETIFFCAVLGIKLGLAHARQMLYH
jgi:hypothetical protein